MPTGVGGSGILAPPVNPADDSAWRFVGGRWQAAASALPSTPLIVNDNALTIQDEVDNSKRFKIQAGTQNTGITTTLDVGAQTANRTLLIPVLAGTDTIVTLATAQTITGAKTFSAGILANSTLAVSGASTTAAITATSASGVTTLAAATQDALRIIGRAGGTGSFIGSLTVPVLAGSVTYTLPAITTTLAGLAVAQTFSALQTFSAGIVQSDPNVGIHSGSTTSVTRLSGGPANDGGVIVLGGSAHASVPNTGILRIGTAPSLEWYSTRVNVPLTTASTSATTGSITNAGGLGNAGAVFFGSTLAVTGATTLSSALTVNGATDAQTITIAAGFALRGPGNAAGFIQVRNAANTAYVDLLYADTTDRAIIPRALRVTGAVTVDSTLAVKGAAAIGAITVATASETSPASAAVWDSAKHSLLAGPGTSATSIALAASVDQTANECSLFSLSPGVSWHGMAIRCLSFSVICNGTTSALKVDDTTTAGNTRLLIYDVDNATLERVTVGAADSGGVGFKVLRIPN